jgi:dihydrofolate reductase
MHVSLLAAVTADGFIGRNADDRSFDWTSEEDKKFYVEMIKKAGVVVMGAQTFKTFTRYPKGLEYYIYTRTPQAFVNPKPAVITATAVNVEPRELVRQLAAKGHKEVAVCGGASIYTQFLKAGVVDTLYLTVEPVMFGSGVKLLNEFMETKLELKEVHHISEQTVVMEYGVKK